MKLFIKPTLSSAKNENFICKSLYFNTKMMTSCMEQVLDIVIGITPENKPYLLWKALFAADEGLIGYECIELVSYSEHTLEFPISSASVYVGLENFRKYTKVTTEKTEYQYWMYHAGIIPDPEKFILD